MPGSTGTTWKCSTRHTCTPGLLPAPAQAASWRRSQPKTAQKKHRGGQVQPSQLLAKSRKNEKEVGRKKDAEVFPSRLRGCQLAERLVFIAANGPDVASGPLSRRLFCGRTALNSTEQTQKEPLITGGLQVGSKNIFSSRLPYATSYKLFFWIPGISGHLLQGSRHYLALTSGCPSSLLLPFRAFARYPLCSTGQNASRADNPA